MKIYTMPVICSICGGEGAATPRDAASEWLGVELVHSDPRVCRDNLKAQIEKEKREELNKGKFKLSI
jgi:hypothetical protein